jgi:hypothetical protein
VHPSTAGTTKSRKTNEKQEHLAYIYANYYLMHQSKLDNSKGGGTIEGEPTQDGESTQEIP